MRASTARTKTENNLNAAPESCGSDLVLVAIGLLCGTCVMQQFGQLPEYWWTVIVLSLAFVMASFARQQRVIWFAVAVLAGLGWAMLRSQFIANDHLPQSIESKDITIIGRVVSLPETHPDSVKFLLQTESILLQGEPLAHSVGKVQLRWYRPRVEVHPGDRWRLTVRLKRPRGLMNPGGFDYERWLFSKRIRATGYVRDRDPESVIRLSSGRDQVSVAGIRQGLRTNLEDVLGETPFKGMLVALALGDRSGIDSAQWRTITRTGINHLIAISGLHIGFVAALVFWLVRSAWRCSEHLLLWTAAPRAAAVGALLFAVGYALLAGFSVPAQRALVMVAVVMASVYFRAGSRPFNTLALALIGVLLIDPLAVNQPGFWLSFSAVAIIFLVVFGRVRTANRWWGWGKIQLALFVGLMPLLLGYFQGVSLVSPLANAVAIPVVTFAVVPFMLLGTVASVFSSTIAAWLLWLPEQALGGLWRFLEWCAQSPWVSWVDHAPPAWTVVLALTGVVMLMMPRGFPAKSLGVFGLIPLFAVAPRGLGQSDFRLTAIDVGQGLATLVETRNHTLLYDTGAWYSTRFDLANAAVLPLLRARQIKRLDHLILSHSDNDHSGAAQPLLDGVSVGVVSSGTSNELADRPVGIEARPCQSGQKWQWDDVWFEVLHPTDGADFERKENLNNRSCVVRISSPSGAALLTGDIEAIVERALVRDVNDRLQADLLIVPHHGSRTSSTEAFINSVDPEIALISAGYFNAYGHPAASVVDRYRQRNIAVFDTMRSGAITVHFRRGAEPEISEHRADHRRYWHSP